MHNGGIIDNNDWWRGGWVIPNQSPPYTGPFIYEKTTDSTQIVEEILKKAAVTDNNDQKEIAELCDSLKEFLLEKNRKYGSSALNPSRIFSRSDSVEQIKVRIDDKLTRLQNQQEDEDEDVIWDLLGYLVLLRIAMKRRDDLQTTDLSST